MKCVEVYKELYHQEPYGVAFCPYRISPLGAHIDHQYGKINGLAIDPNDEGGMAWNDPEIGIEWPELKGEYKGSASAEGYTLKDGTALNLSDKDQKWLGLKDTFKF